MVLPLAIVLTSRMTPTTPNIWWTLPFTHQSRQFAVHLPSVQLPNQGLHQPKPTAVNSEPDTHRREASAVMVFSIGWASLVNPTTFGSVDSNGDTECLRRLS